MDMTFRWYGKKNDTITLDQIKQIPNVKGIVWALHDKNPGEIWTKEEIENEVSYIKSHGFHADVVESVNVHEAIKLGNNDRDKFIENYKETIRNLAASNVKVVCYNFMPIFDWTRTDLYYELEDGSTALFYSDNKIKSIQPEDLISTITSSTDLRLPGWEPEKLGRIKELFKAYEQVSEEQLWENLTYFLKAILPTCEKYNIKMAIHPDDPPWSLFGLPRIMINETSLKRILEISNSSSNCITFCTGSLGANENNDLVSLVDEHSERFPFVHIRNIKRFKNGDFVETSHLTQDGHVKVDKIVQKLHEKKFTGYVRPDHGRHLWGEKCRPGYGLYDRALGIMYLSGLWDAYNNM